MAKTIFYSLAALVRKILFLPLENKIHIFAPPWNILYIWHAGHACFEFAEFRKQKIHSQWPFPWKRSVQGNGPYGKIPTKKEPIRTLGLTLPYNKNPYFTFEFRSCPDSFNGSICLESAQATYVTSLFKSRLKYAKLAVVFSKIHRTRIVGVQNVKETHKVI